MFFYYFLMKSELSIHSFNEIPVQQQQELNGGAFPFLVGLGLLAIAQVILDWDNFKNGLIGRPEEESNIIINIQPR